MAGPNYNNGNGAGTIEQYMFPSRGSTPGAPSTTQIDETPFASFVSPNPTEAANAWDLPPNAGTLRLPTGITQQVPTNSKDQALIGQSVQMVDLYLKMANGTKLNPSEVKIASELGGDIARAAQMQGSKGGQAAVAKALNEMNTRLKNVGITPKALLNPSSKVPPQLSAMLQNAGYAVTKNMTFTQMLQETSGPKAQTPLPTMSQGLTIGQYIQGLGNLTKPQIAQLQHSLFNSGMYDSSYEDGSKTITQGVLDNATILAFRNAMMHSLSTNTPLEQVIGGSLPMPTATQPAPASGSSLPGAASNTFVNQAQASQLQSPLIKAFESALGRAPTQQELTAFTSSYNAEQETASKYAVAHNVGIDPNTGNPQTSIDLQTGVPFLTSTPTASAASSAFAMNHNPVEFQGKGIADAFGMLMNLVDRQGTSALNTPGHSPNVMA